jgi:hypothetical protein
MVIHPIARVAIRPAVATLAAVVLAAFAGNACRQAPPGRAGANDDDVRLDDGAVSRAGERP